jgi:hypothetical protein
MHPTAWLLLANERIAGLEADARSIRRANEARRRGRDSAPARGLTLQQLQAVGSTDERVGARQANRPVAVGRPLV